MADADTAMADAPGMDSKPTTDTVADPHPTTATTENRALFAKQDMTITSAHFGKGVTPAYAELLCKEKGLTSLCKKTSGADYNTVLILWKFKVVTKNMDKLSEDNAKLYGLIKQWISTSFNKASMQQACRNHGLAADGDRTKGDFMCDLLRKLTGNYPETDKTTQQETKQVTKQVNFMESEDADDADDKSKRSIRINDTESITPRSVENSAWRSDDGASVQSIPLPSGASDYTAAGTAYNTTDGHTLGGDTASSRLDSGAGSEKDDMDIDPESRPATASVNTTILSTPSSATTSPTLSPDQFLFFIQELYKDDTKAEFIELLHKYTANAYHGMHVDLWLMLTESAKSPMEVKLIQNCKLAVEEARALENRYGARLRAMEQENSKLAQDKSHLASMVTRLQKELAEVKDTREAVNTELMRAIDDCATYEGPYLEGRINIWTEQVHLSEEIEASMQQSLERQRQMTKGAKKGLVATKEQSQQMQDAIDRFRQGQATSRKGN